MRIFVYGSLRTKQGNSHWMTNAQLLGNYNIENYQLYSLGHYPGAVPGNGTVQGEVYRIDNATLAELDALRTRAVNMHVSWSRLRTGVPGCTCISGRSMD